MRFTGKVGVITGGSSGMGKATADLLAAEGCKVFVLDIRPTADHEFLECDVSDYARVKSALAEVLRTRDNIDVLFAAAGYHLFSDIEETGVDEFERILAVNLKGTFYVLKEVLPIMRRQNRGNIVLMGSDQALIGKGSSSAYGLTKAAIGSLTKSAAIDYAKYNIRVNCLCPGTIDTPMLAPSLQRFHELSGLSKEEIYDKLREAQPIRRLGTAEEIARTAAFLLSEECAFMTGALICVDGGYTCQ